MHPADSVAPPPLPASVSIDTVSAGPPPLPARSRSPAGLLPAAAAGAVASDAVLWSEDVGRYGPGGYGIVVALVAAAGAVFLMRKGMKWRTPAFAGLVLCAIASAWTGSGLSVLLAPVLLAAWATHPASGDDGPGESGVAGVGLWLRALCRAVAAVSTRVFRGRAGVWAAGLGVLGVSLYLLGAGNIVLGHYVDIGLRRLGEWLSIDAGDLARCCVWGWGVIGLSPLALSRRRDGLWVPVTSPVKPVAAVLAGLAGANLAFLASNLTDTWCIGVLRAAPAGMSTTDYLHSGTYSLVFDAMLAAGLLFAIFRNGGPARASRPARLLGVLLLAQCAWLGLGVLGRIGLQIGRFGFTPNRVWVVVILLWGYVALWAAIRFLRVRPEPRAWIRSAFWSGVAMLSLLQFRSPAVLASDLNIAFHRSHPEWKFDAGYYAAVGPDGYRLWRALPGKGSFAGDSGEAVSGMVYWSGVFDRPTPDWRVRSFRSDALRDRFFGETTYVATPDAMRRSR